MRKKSLLLLVLALTLAATAQKNKKTAPNRDASEDVSGMYSFLHDGEFLEIDLDQNGVSGYISRRGELDSDRGQFLDQFFDKAAIAGHEVSFTTRPVHGIWFEFKGRVERGNAKVRTDDGYFVLKGTLIQFQADAGKSATSRSREVEFKSMAQPAEESK